LESGFGHGMTANVGGEPGMDVGRAVDGLTQEPRREPLAQRQPRRVDRLGGVVGKCAGDALRPHMSAVAIEQLEQENTPNRLDAGGNAERFLERKRDLAEDDSIETEHWLDEGRGTMDDGRERLSS